MEDYKRDHRLYLAERQMWLDRHVNKTSVKSLIKIESWKQTEAGDDRSAKILYRKMIIESLLNEVPVSTILMKEGFYKMNLDN